MEIIPTGQQIRMARSGLGLSVKQLADLAGTSAGPIRLWERNRDVKVDSARKICAALHVKGVEFLAGNAVRITPKEQS